MLTGPQLVFLCDMIRWSYLWKLQFPKPDHEADFVYWKVILRSANKKRYKSHLKHLCLEELLPLGVQGAVGLNPRCGGACFRIDFAAFGGGIAVGVQGVQ